MNKKLVASLMIAMLMLQTVSYAAPKEVVQEEPTITVATPAETKEVLTLEMAIEKGLKNSLLFQEVENTAAITKLVKENAFNIQNDLNNATSDLGQAQYLIDDGRDQIYEGKNQLDAAQAAYENNQVPKAITWGQLAASLGESGKLLLKVKDPSQVAVSAGMSFEQAAKQLNQEVGALLMQLVGAGVIPPEMASQMAAKPITSETIKAAVKGEIDSSSAYLASSEKKLEASTQEYLEGQSAYEASLKYALSSVTSKLSTHTISSLEGDALGDLIVKMSTKQDEVASYAVNIYRNQVALLIENSYFEALKEQELLAVKKKAEERGRKQYELATAAFEVGVKSKDDMLIAKSYYDATVMNTALQQKAYDSALLTLKKNLNVDLEEDFQLEVVIPDCDATFDLEQGIASGLRARLEMKMAQAGKDTYGYLMTALDDSAYSDTSPQHQEVALLQKQAEIAYQSEEKEVELSIRESYQAMMTTKALVERAHALRESAEETVEMAKAKYEAGYSCSNALLASLNLEEMAGTPVEVMAAEENLSTIEEKEVEAMNGYQLAQLKYLNDIGVLPY